MGGKSLRINVHPRVITLGRILQRGNKEFSELHPRDKKLLLSSPVSLRGLVPEEELERERMKIQLEESNSIIETATIRGRLALKEFTN